jgi:hypothetical protein
MEAGHTDFVHGYSAYKEHGCRCEQCVSAFRGYSESLRRRKGMLPRLHYEDDLVAKAVEIAVEDGIAAAADITGMSKTKVYVACREAGVTPWRHRTRHGTRHYYARYGCRCDVCVEGNRVEARATKERREKKEPPKHGTDNAYTNYACRCEPCRAAGSARNKRYRVERKKRDPGWKG